MIYVFGACLVIVALFLDRAWSFYRYCFFKEGDEALPVKRMKVVYLANVLLDALATIQATYGRNRREILLTLIAVAGASVVIWGLFHLVGYLTEKKGLAKTTLTMLFIVVGVAPPAAIAWSVFSGSLFELLKLFN